MVRVGPQRHREKNTLIFVSYLTEDTNVLLLERPVDKAVWRNVCC